MMATHGTAPPGEREPELADADGRSTSTGNASRRDDDGPGEPSAVHVPIHVDRMAPARGIATGLTIAALCWAIFAAVVLLLRR